MEDNLSSYINAYTNSAAHNDYLFEHFTQKTNEISFLKNHRDHIEAESLGFGERAFAYMWYLITQHVCAINTDPQFLEIGVFKGQVISLWALIAKELHLELRVTGVSPLAGNSAQKLSWIQYLHSKISKKYRDDMGSGNNYDDIDYLSIIKNLFTQLGLNFNDINLLKGYSTDLEIIDQLSKQEYAVIYIDGDHTFAGVVSDIKNYAPLVKKGGLLIMDDASCDLPGIKFWKGHQSVSNACRLIDDMPFKNILNIGHNRVYQKQ